MWEFKKLCFIYLHIRYYPLTSVLVWLLMAHCYKATQSNVMCSTSPPRTLITVVLPKLIPRTREVHTMLRKNGFSLSPEKEFSLILCHFFVFPWVEECLVEPGGSVVTQKLSSFPFQLLLHPPKYESPSSPEFKLQAKGRSFLTEC